MHPLIKKLAIVLFLLASVYSSIVYLIESVQAWNPRLITNDGVYDWDARLAKARKDLPADIKVIGYVSEWDILPDYDYPDNETEYVLTQFAMAPVIVTRDDHHEWILVNLSPKDFETWAATQPANIKVTKYRQGLYLVQKP